MTFPSITNRGEFFSNHYLDAVIGGDLGDLRKAWDEAEGKGEPSARSTLKGAASRFFKTRATASEATGDRAPAAIEHLNDVVLQALGFQPNRQNLDLVRNTTDRLTIRAAATAETGTGRWLVAIDAGLAEAHSSVAARFRQQCFRLIEAVGLTLRMRGFSPLLSSLCKS